MPRLNTLSAEERSGLIRRNPDFGQVLLENCANGYCRSHQAEVVRHWYLPFAREVAAASGKGALDETMLTAKCEEMRQKLLTTPLAELGGKSVGEALLAPTRIYVKPVLALLEAVTVKGISHITGGGFYENIPRSIPAGLCAKIEKSSVKVLPIFDLIAKQGNIPERDMFNTYNMGVGMSIVVSASDAGKAAKEIVPFDDNQTALMDLEKGGVDAVFLDEIVARYWISQNGKDYVVLEEGLSDEEYAIGFRKKDQALRDAVDATLAAMKADGKFAEISAKWFGK